MQFFMMFQSHSIIMFVAVLAFALAVGLKSVKGFLIQLALFILLVASFIMDGAMANISFYILAVVQTAFAAFMVYRCKKAIDMDYILVLEKTHLIRPKITLNGNAGTRKTFL